MRLIDADQLILYLSNCALLESPSNVESADDRKVSRAVCQAIKECVRVVDERPTAFDVDKVMKRLKKELKLADKEKQRCAKENIYQFDEAKGYARAIDVAIEIVKGGGAG
nr:MAG TPA: hypothetical protein [Caudoviricetes sp.]